MQLDALWTVEFATNHGDFGTGVAVLVEGRIYGGDSHHCYDGEYEFSAGEVSASVRVQVHNGRPFPGCAEGEQVEVLLRGRPVAGELELNGVLQHEPPTQLFVHMVARVPFDQAAPADRDLPPPPDPTPPAAVEHPVGYLIGESTDALRVF